MASLYLPSTIDTPKKEIARYEGGYIRNCLGILIGRYDDKLVYDGTSILNTNFIGRMEFNYGYLRSSNEIFVKSHSDGSLSVGKNRFAAYFDGDEKGAIAAFILCYTKGMIEIASNNSVNDSEDSTNTPSSMPLFQSSSSFSDENENTGGGGGCILPIVGVLIAILCTVVAFTGWLRYSFTFFIGDMDKDAWIIIIPIVSIAIAIKLLKGTPKKGLMEIGETYLNAFTVPICIGSIIYAIQFGGIVHLFTGFAGLCVFSIPPFLIGVIISYYKAKNK